MGLLAVYPLQRYAMSATDSRLLLASIHDVSPRFESEIDRLIGLLFPYVGCRFAMLVVPNHWGSAPIVPGSPFATKLRRWKEQGVEIFLHGFTHRDDSRHDHLGKRLSAAVMTAGEGEFLGLSRAEATNRIGHGRALLEAVTGYPIDGFIAPAWLYGNGALAALEEAAMPIAEDHLHVWSPQSGRTLATGPVITWASRSRLRLASSLLAAAMLRRAPIRVLRIGVHPPDARNSSLVKSICTTLGAAANGRRAAQYSELLEARLRTSGRN
jgi:predicted deacetylase